MTPKADKFISDVWDAAWIEQKPITVTNSQLFDPVPSAGAIRRAAKWLTPKILDSYDPGEYQNLSGEQRDELNRAVAEFRFIASEISSDQAPTASRFREGLQKFDRLKSDVKRVVLTDWERAAGALIAIVETWAKEFVWVTRRENIELKETLLGEYRLDQLYLHAEGNLYILNPIARFVPGGHGSFELQIQPQSDYTSIFRNCEGEWRIHGLVGPGYLNEYALTKETFRRALIELRSLR